MPMQKNNPKKREKVPEKPAWCSLPTSIWKGGLLCFTFGIDRCGKSGCSFVGKKGKK